MSSHSTTPDPSGFVARPPGDRIVDNTMWEGVMAGEFQQGQMLEVNGRPVRVISATPIGGDSEGAALSRVVYHPLSEVEIFEMDIRAANETATEEPATSIFGGILDPARRPGLQARPPLRPIGRPAPDVIAPAAGPPPLTLAALNRAYEQGQVTPEEYLREVVSRGDGQMLQQADEPALRQAHSIARQICHRPPYRDQPQYRAFERLLRAELDMIDEMRRQGIEVTAESRTEQHRIRGAEQVARMHQSGLLSAQTTTRFMGVDWAMRRPPSPPAEPVGRDDFLNAVRDMHARVHEMGLSERDIERVYVHPRTAAEMRRVARDELGDPSQRTPESRFTMFGLDVNASRQVEPGLVMAEQELPAQGNPERVRGTRANAVVIDDRQVMADNATRELLAEMDRNILAGLRDALPAGTPVRVSVTEDVEAAEEVLDDGTRVNRNGDAYTGEGADQRYVVQVEAARPFASNVGWGDARVQLEGFHRALRVALAMFAEEAGVEISQSVLGADEAVHEIRLEGELIGTLALFTGAVGTLATSPRPAQAQESGRRQTPEEGQRALEL